MKLKSVTFEFIIGSAIILLPFYGTSQNTCARQPEFVQQLNYDLSRSGFSTSDRMNMGIIFAEFKDPRNPGEYTRVYQHPSWKSAGFLGSIIFDEAGNIYIAPLPVVNSLHNPAQEKNTIFKIDHASGVMERFFALPIESKYDPRNPFGIVGMTYDCDSKSLYVSTLEGSDGNNENGKIFRVNVATGKSELIIDHTDALGLATFVLQGQKKLFYGSARSSKIFSISLDNDNAADSIAVPVINLGGLGPRGDDKARKLKFSSDGKLHINAVEFDYNLIAPTVKQETVYTYVFSPQKNEWQPEY